MSEPRLQQALPRVTERQWQVAELVALGYSNNEIADQIGVSVAGAKYHVSELLRRLRLRRREEVAAWYRSERAVRGHAIELSAFEPPPLPGAIRERAAELGWPPELLDRAEQLRVGGEDLARWLRFGPYAEYERPHTAEELEHWLRNREQLMFGTMRSRVATFGDNEALATLYEHASEPAGDSDVFVERSPHAFAQFRLLDDWHVQVLEDRGLALAAVARSYPVIQIDGRLMRSEHQLGFVVRDDARGHQYSRLISHVPRPAQAWPIAIRVYYYVRPENVLGAEWVAEKGRTSATLAPANGTQVPGFPATVHHLSGASLGDTSPDIRPAEPQDLEACARLINERHRDVPYFIPTSAERLAARLERGGFADERGLWPRVYGWGDLYVLERAGRVVACLGFWDAGLNVREVWVHRRSGRRTVVESAAVLDAGFERGAEAAFVCLVDHAMRLTSDSGRNRLAIWLDREPDLVSALEQRYAVTSETRIQQCSLEDGRPPLQLERPFVDLAYW